MPEIIDVLTLNPANCQTFIGNSAVESVTATLPGGAPTYRARNAFARNRFTNGDSLKILSGGIILPEGFTIRQKITNTLLPSITFFPEGVTSGQFYFSPNFSDEEIFIPLENYELVFDTFLSCRESVNQIDPTKTLLSEDFYLRLYNSHALEISMIGTPAAITGKTFWIVPWLKILHNIPLR